MTQSLTDILKEFQSKSLRSTRSLKEELAQAKIKIEEMFGKVKVYNEDVIFMCKKHLRVNCGECFEVLPKPNKKSATE